MGKKVISYCLFGNKLKYCHGIIEAVISSNLFFLDWEVRVYYSVGKQAVPKSVINILNNLNCTIIPFSETSTGTGEDIEGMMQRYQPLNDADVDYWLSRDADSRTSLREKKMVDEWISSNKALHSILDHPCHGGIMGGLFGVNNIIMRKKYPEQIIDIKKTISELAKKFTIRRGYDQNWINNHFSSIIKNNKDIFVHLNNKPDCLKRCHINHKRPVNDHYESKLVEHDSNFCGKQINYTDSKLKRPVLEIENLKLEGTI